MIFEYSHKKPEDKFIKMIKKIKKNLSKIKNQNIIGSDQSA